jgi:hypothetical protein
LEHLQKKKNIRKEKKIPNKDMKEIERKKKKGEVSKKESVEIMVKIR